MTYAGVVKQGKIELAENVTLPEGTPVGVEVVQRDWRTEWENFASRVTEQWQGSDSAVETVSKMRR
ncbi:MAG: hypothetical protein AMXMBFR13_25270 [Phycisphaerae bacterium]